ncbi:hypothetical protein [Bradyrhizobium sp. Tv2a-2]|uniref:hypothetical protein n=1 Tax=Bradyrhizobium sp. Tv2a-2 TaxID=113395 RepID=UPI0004648658|nr:hypothetical protein [Bradyrhizobium sp. Tv2a-2]
MSNWIDSGGHEPRQFSDAYAYQNDSHRCDGRWKLPLRLACAALLVILTAQASQARDPDGRYAAQNPELHQWFESLRSGKGPCCSDADGTAVSDVDWETANGHYRVRLDGEWVEVPDEAVITEPNRIGRTMVWPIRGYLGISIRCFMPGSMT